MTAVATEAQQRVDTAVLDGPRSRWFRPRGLTLLGPAFVAAIAYVDPGNVAANLQSGAKFGYMLTWVLVAAVACAGLVQYQSAKLGVVTGKSLPELIGERTKTRGRVLFWLQAEAVAVSTDLAEVVGGAVALQLLFNVPLLMGGCIAGAVSVVLLLVQDRRGQKPFERVITGLLVVIAVGFVAGLFVSPPAPGEVAAGLIPRFAGNESLLLAAAMFGATVMPHAVYLHSALTRDRFGDVAPGRKRRLLKATRTDVITAMTLAGAVNIAMLLLAASALRGHSDVDTLSGAHAAINSSLGTVVGVLFGIGLLVSGLASTSVGCYAGSVILSGLLRRKVSMLARRLVTLIPALIVLAIGVEPTMALVVSQVILSFGLPFAVIPLMKLTSNRDLMGVHVNSRLTKIAGWTVCAAVSALNIALLAGAFLG